MDAAVVGTGRAALPPVPPVLAALVGPAAEARPADGDAAPEDAGKHAAASLLSAAGAASRARRAGQQPADASDAAAPQPAPADPRPDVSGAAMRRLSDLLATDRTDLVLEWLRMLSPTGCRPPDALVPTLLTAAGVSRDLRDAVTELVGPLAGWLAAANPEWAWITVLGPGGQPDPAAWPTSSHRERRALLEWLRRSDPAAGRELVLSTWDTDTARDRTAFVVTLGTGLGAGRRGTARPGPGGQARRGAGRGRGTARAAAGIKVLRAGHRPRGCSRHGAAFDHRPRAGRGSAGRGNPGPAGRLHRSDSAQGHRPPVVAAPADRGGRAIGVVAGPHRAGAVRAAGAGGGHGVGDGPGTRLDRRRDPGRRRSLAHGAAGPPGRPGRLPGAARRRPRGLAAPAPGQSRCSRPWTSCRRRGRPGCPTSSARG